MGLENKRLQRKLKKKKQYDNLSLTLGDLIIFEDNQTIDILNHPFNYLSFVSGLITLPRKKAKNHISLY